MTPSERAEKIVNSDEMSPYFEDYKPSQKANMVTFIAAQISEAEREAVKNTMDNCSEWLPNKSYAKGFRARLEAAEVCAELTYFHYGGGSEAGLTPMALELKQSSEVWRKAAGK